MEIVITTTIRFIKKVTKGNVEESNLAENNKDKIANKANQKVNKKVNKKVSKLIS
jgi:hypothetical protein